MCFIARQSQHTLTIQTTNQISKPTRVADTKRGKSRADKLRIGTGAPLPPPFVGDFHMEVMGVLIRDKLGAWLRFYLTRPKRDYSKTGN